MNKLFGLLSLVTSIIVLPVACIASARAGESSPEQVLFEADLERADWLRPVVGNIDLFAEADQEFGGRDYGAQSVALGRAGVSLEQGILTLKGLPGRVAGVEIPEQVILDLPSAPAYILTMDMRLTDIDAPGYYMGPRVNRGHGRGVQRFLNREMPDWQRVEFYVPNGPGDSGAIRLAYYAGTGNWQIRRLYIRAVDERDAFPWDLPEGEAEKPLLVQIDEAEATPVNPLLHGYNPNFSRTRKITFNDEEVQFIIEESGIQALRFPTGTQSNWYEWEIDGWPEELPEGIPAFVPISAALVREHRGTYGQAAFIEVVKEYGLEPVLVLNILTQSPESMVRWLKYLESEGVPVRYIELGNETYHDRQANEFTATGELYAAHVRSYVEAIREEFPEVVFSAPVISRAMRGDGWDWNRQVAEHAGDILEGITLHTYSHAFGVPLNHEMVIEMLYPDELNVQGHIKQKERFFPGMKIWNTEWNINAPPVMPNDTQLGAMQNALYLLSLIRNEEHFEMATLHSLSSSDFSPVMMRGHGGARQTLLRRAFFAHALLRDLFKPGGEWYATVVEEGLEPFDGRFGRADAQAVRMADGSLVLVVINRLPVAKPLEVQGIEGAGEARLFSLSSDSLGDRKAVPPGQTLVVESAWSQGGELPPYSINKLVFQP